MNRRFLIIIIISAGIHLGLLAVRFLPGSRVVTGQQHLVFLVAGKQENFTPVETKIPNNRIMKISSTPHRMTPQIKSMNKTRNLTSSVTAAMSLVLVSTSDKVNEEVLSTQQTAEGAPSKRIEKSVSADTLKLKHLPLEIKDVGLKGRVEQSSIQPDMRLTGNVDPIIALAGAVPRYADNPKPEYPAIARSKGWSGEVKLLVRVDKIGDVDRISVSRSSGYAALDRAARRAVRLWRFIPAIKAGFKVASEVLIPINFRLPSSSEIVGSIQE